MCRKCYLAFYKQKEKGDVRNEEVVRIICIVLCVGLILGLGYIVSRKIKKYPDEVEYSSLRAFADDGMYYIKRNVLYFWIQRRENR